MTSEAKELRRLLLGSRPPWPFGKDEYMMRHARMVAGLGARVWLVGPKAKRIRHEEDDFADDETQRAAR